MLPAAVLSVPGSGHMKAWYGVPPSSLAPTACGTWWRVKAAAFVGYISPVNIVCEVCPCVVGDCASTCSGIQQVKGFTHKGTADSPCLKMQDDRLWYRSRLCYVNRNFIRCTVTIKQKQHIIILRCPAAWRAYREACLIILSAELIHRHLALQRHCKTGC